MSISKSSRENKAEVVGCIASVFAVHRIDQTMELSDDGGRKVVHIGYLDGDREIWLRTENGEVWIVTANQLGSALTFKEHTPSFKSGEVRENFERFQLLEQQWGTIKQVVDSMDADADLALQSWVEDVLSDDERECWHRWSSGGHATTQEWDIVSS